MRLTADPLRSPALAAVRALAAVAVAAVLPAVGGAAEVPAAVPGSEASLALAIGANLAQARDMATALAAAMVSAPNARIAIDPATDPGPEELARLGVSEQVRIEVGPPAATLLVWIIRPAPAADSPRGQRGSILFLHGICSSRGEHLGHARHVAAQGYTAVLPDLRGQGRSTGQWLTYGWQEARDLQRLLDVLSERRLMPAPVGVFGASYGAATANLLAAIEPRVKAVVSVASYTAMAEVVPQYVREFAPFLRTMVNDQQIQEAVAAAGRLAGFDPAEASPLDAVRRHAVPTLFLHGEKDINIPYHHAEQLAAAARGPCRLVAVPGAAHHCGGSEFVRTQAMAWFDRWLGPGDPAAAGAE